MAYKNVIYTSFYYLRHFFCVTLLLALFLSSCCSHRMTDRYISRYRYLRDYASLQEKRAISSKDIPPYFILVNVSAPRLNYETFNSFLHTLQWNILGRRDPVIGHVWTILSGRINGDNYFIEGGHSGELGLTAPRYFDEVIHRAIEGNDPNPVQYLYKSLPDGYFEIGPGSHTATSSILIPLSKEQFLSCISLFNPNDGYEFSRWSLCNHNCITFIQSLLSRAGIHTYFRKTDVQIPKKIYYGKKELTLWCDHQFSTFSLTTVDDVEFWMISLLAQKQAFCSKKWYRTEFNTWKRKHIDVSNCIDTFWKSIATQQTE